MSVSLRLRLGTTLCACLMVNSLMVTPSTSAPRNVPSENFGVLLDAGSSSTKLKVYRWTSAPDATSVPRIELVKTEKFSPGVSTFLESMDGLKDYLKDVLSAAQTEVPAESHATTPVYLMATAGLRFASAEDANKLLGNIRRLFADPSVNPFTFTPSGVTILSGEEEGAYAWLAANYLLGYFDEYKPFNQSVGIMEMGGASTQISFIPNSPLYAEEFHVTVASRLYQLYVQSYLQYGIDAMKVKIGHELYKEDPDKDEYENPCLLKDDQASGEYDGAQYEMIGTGDADKCREILLNLVAPATGDDCMPKPCAIGSRYQPSIDGIQFYATSAFTYAPKALGVVGEDKGLHLEALENEGHNYCEQTLQEAVDAGNNAKYASNSCMMSMYIPALLTEAYGFSKDTDDVKVTTKIGDEAIDWALGAMLEKLSITFTGGSQACALTRRRR